MGRHLDNRDARDTTLLHARRIISQLASSLRLPPLYVDRAYRLYQLALHRNFNVGRRQSHVVATCLYIVCRQEKSPHLLIDFSDALQVNVYTLGRAFLQFVRVLRISLPLLDPSLYLHRYADKLSLGDRAPAVVSTSLRIITRLKKDWIVTGRRPDGVCAAALLIAARAHEFNVSQETIAALFRIATITIRKRVAEFKATPAAQLTLAQFVAHGDSVTVEFDPPAFIQNKLVDNDEGIDLMLDEAQDDGGDGADGNDRADLPMVTAAELAQDNVYQNSSEDEDEVRRALPQPRSRPLRIGSTLTVDVPLPTLEKRVKNSLGLQSRHQDRAELYNEIYAEIAAHSSSTRLEDPQRRSRLAAEAQQVPT